MPRSSATSSGRASRRGAASRPRARACAACSAVTSADGLPFARFSAFCERASPRPTRSASSSSPRTVASSSAGSASAPKQRITSGERVDLAQLRDALRRGDPSRHVDEPHLRRHGLLRALHLGQDSEPRVGDGHDRDVGLTAVRARAGQGREEGRLPGERHADQPDVLHARRAYQPVAARRTGGLRTGRRPGGGAGIGRSARKLRPFGQCCNGRRAADVEQRDQAVAGCRQTHPAPPGPRYRSGWTWLIAVWSSCGRAGIRRPRPSAVSSAAGPGNGDEAGASPRPRAVSAARAA